MENVNLYSWLVHRSGDNDRGVHNCQAYQLYYCSKPC